MQLGFGSVISTIGGVEQSTVVECFLKHDNGFTFQEIYSLNAHIQYKTSVHKNHKPDLEDPSTWASSTIHTVVGSFFL